MVHWTFQRIQRRPHWAALRYLPRTYCKSKFRQLEAGKANHALGVYDVHKKWRLLQKSHVSTHWTVLYHSSTTKIRWQNKASYLGIMQFNFIRESVYGICRETWEPLRLDFLLGVNWATHPRHRRESLLQDFARDTDGQGQTRICTDKGRTLLHSLQNVVVQSDFNAYSLPALTKL